MKRREGRRRGKEEEEEESRQKSIDKFDCCWGEKWLRVKGGWWGFFGDGFVFSAMINFSLAGYCSVYWRFAGAKSKGGKTKAGVRRGSRESELSLEEGGLNQRVWRGWDWMR